jgi:transcriptional regulator with GAF, ATPase, and Fis domain
MNSSLDIKQILNNMTADVSTALGMKGADIRLLNQTKNELTLVSSHGLSQNFLGNPQMNRSEITRSVLAGNSAVMNNIFDNDPFQLMNLFKQEGIGACIMAPVRARNEVIGTLSLYSETPRHFSKEVKVMIEALAHQGGLAIQNASLYLKLEDDKKNLEADIWSHRSWF